MPADLLDQIMNYLGLGGGIGGGYAVWLSRANKEDIDKLDDFLRKLDQENDKIKDLLAEHKLYSANTYAKLDDVKGLINELSTDVKYLRQKFDEVLTKKD